MAFSVTTKISLQPGENPKLIQEKARRALERLQVDQVDTLLLHNEERLLGSTDVHEIVSILRQVKEQGFARKTGFSSYDPGCALQLCEQHGFDVVQLPANLFDRRLFENNVLEGFLAANVTVQVRSAFLQGTLLGTPRDERGIPRHVVEESKRFQSACHTQGIKPLGAALAPLLAAPAALKIIVGVTGWDELEEIIQGLANARLPENYSPPVWRSEFDPRTWCK